MRRRGRALGGNSALITARGDRPDLTIAPVRPNEEAPRWGLPADREADQMADQVAG
ncbi:hypothetical protein [Streptomyces caeruleatus]|uniref:hypothetical protein n=1 Tax=Streptomyces caeruleatus TaxID=661399 RepID=UPI000A61C63F|nr:hypothetical protein [Streptomyces caeruleatus]